MKLRHRCVALAILTALALFGCRNKQHAHVLKQDDADMVGSHAAGAETWKPLIDESVGRLLGRQTVAIAQVSGNAPPLGRQRICFIGVENLSAEEIGDFKEQIYEHIDTLISRSEMFAPINRRFVEAGLRESRVRPDELFIPSKRQLFTLALEQMQQPFDYLLFAKITSGTTNSNGDYQRDYLLTLELVQVDTGDYDKESATLRKGYHKSALGKLKHYND